MTDYDSPWKEILDQFFEPFVAFFFPILYAQIDWTRGHEFLDKELQKICHESEVGRRTVDKLVRVWLKNGQETWLLIHIEIQNQRDNDFDRRMFVYHYRIFDHYNRTVVSLAVLGDDEPAWRPGRFSYDNWGCGVTFLFPTVKLLDYGEQEAALEAAPNPFAAVVLAHLKTLETRGDPETRRDWKVRLVKGLHERGWPPEDVHNLIRFIDWLMELPGLQEEIFWQEVHTYQEEKHMPFVDIFERKATEKGMREGLREGLLDTIELGLELRFGDFGLQLMSEIRPIQDLDVLRAIRQAIKTVVAPEDLRPLWSQPG